MWNESRLLEPAVRVDNERAKPGPFGKKRALWRIALSWKNFAYGGLSGKTGCLDQGRPGISGNEFSLSCARNFVKILQRASFAKIRSRFRHPGKPQKDWKVLPQNSFNGQSSQLSRAAQLRAKIKRAFTTSKLNKWILLSLFSINIISKIF